ncbi:MAG TPA: phosphoglucomutase/phosphomannomutase family protein [Dehalococcoidales bacterium]|nr:phosphoglucomutase/phosphomannomutase family protein [Dehalococcoidales bacterium]
MNNPIKFGTDGWRAVIAEDFTFDNVRVCAQAVADYLKQTKLAGRRLIVGYDTRFASEDFAAACAEVVAANGIKVWLCSKASPTPVVSYGTMAKKAGGAIIITASHNAAAYNGFKIKTPDGAGAPDEVTAAVEKNIARILAGKKIERLPLAEAVNKKLVEYLDLAPIYSKQVAKLVDIPGLKKAKLKVIVDSMYGAGSGYLKRLLDGGNLEVLEINGERNPGFPGIRPEPITANLGKLSATVKKEKAAVGIATDGDADRVGIMDEKGRFVTQLQVFALLALYLLEVRGERGAIVKTITATSMLYRLGELFKVPVRETSVGFKYIAPVMMKENALIGGEESGGFGFRGHAPERDGILAGLYFLDLMVKTGKTPSQLVDYLYSKVGPHHYDRIDVEFPASERQAIIDRVKGNRPKEIAGSKVVKIDTTDGFRFTLADNSWLLVRFSGTEPLLRIYTETSSPARVKTLLEAGKALAGVEK